VANRDCNGDYFSVSGARWYACLWDSAVVPAPAAGLCPSCKREIDAQDAGEVQTYTRTYAMVNGREVVVPPPSTAGALK